MSIRRQGNAVVLEPIRKTGWPKGDWERLLELRRDLEVEPMEPIFEEVALGTG